MENPIKMDDLGVPLFLETSIYEGPNQRIQALSVYGCFVGLHVGCFSYPLATSQERVGVAWWGCHRVGVWLQSQAMHQPPHTRIITSKLGNHQPKTPAIGWYCLENIPNIFPTQ